MGKTILANHYHRPIKNNRVALFTSLKSLYHVHIYRPKLSFTLFNSCISSKLVFPCHFTVVGGDAYKSYVTQHPPIRLRLGTMSHAPYNPQYKKSMVVFFSPYDYVWGGLVTFTRHRIFG